MKRYAKIDFTCDSPGITIQLKTRSFIHGSWDREPFAVRRDSSFADLRVFPLILFLGVILAISSGTADVRGAYLQCEPIRRDLFVCAIKEYAKSDEGQKGKCRRPLWTLLKLPYGVVEAGRQWLCAPICKILSEYGMERVSEADKLLMRICKVLDNWSAGRQVFRWLHNRRPQVRDATLSVVPRRLLYCQ